MDILVTGGAGYIGSYMCKYLSQKGYQPIVLDNLSRGNRQAVKWGPFYEGNISDGKLVDRICQEHTISAVMHFAAFAYVGESVLDPAMYYQNNVAETINLLFSLVKNGVSKIVFSSTCAIYGEPLEIPIAEDHPKKPINPYGRGKLMVEQILGDFNISHGVEAISLRYFNAAGADPDVEIGEYHTPEPHLIPRVLLAALGQREGITINGDDYDTRDGTCIRDYVHIADLAQAHHLSLERLLSGKLGDSFNLGNGIGYSVKEIIDTAGKIAGKPIATTTSERRAGDPATLIGSSEKAIKELGWKPQFTDLESIIETAWRWHKSHPNGYKDD